MTRRLLCLLLSLSLAHSAPAAAQTEGADLALGIRQVEEGDLALAIITLDGVVQKLTGVPGRTSDLALAHLYLGMAHLGISQWERAKTEMREAWRNNKGMKLDPKKFPPRVIQAYEEAKTEAANGPKPAGAPTPAAAASPADTGKAKEGGGSSKTLLIVGGVAAAAGVAALAGGGGSKATTVAATPVATPRPTPQLLQSGSFSFGNPNLYSVRDVVVPAAGTLQFTANWTFGTNTFGLNIGQGAWAGTFGPFVASSPFTNARAITLTYNAAAAGTYCFYVFFVSGSGGESGSYQVVLNRN
jgi:hypothetical protein